MPVLIPEPLVTFERSYRWRNKHQNVSATAERLYNAWNRTKNGSEPAAQRWRAGLNALRRIVSAAEAAGKSVRAYGGGWSLSDAAATSGFLINTKPLNYISIGLRPSQVLKRCEPVANRLVFAQCGIHVMELHTALEGAGLALPTSGASNGQTLAGAVSTGTHGAAWAFGSMQECVRGLHLVVEGGRHIFVEPARAPLVSKSFVDTLGAERIRSDALFDAALVSFGSFGVVHALLLEAVPLYDLLKYRFRADHAAALDSVDLDFVRLARSSGAALPPAQPYHFELTFDPYRPGAGERGAYVTAMYAVDHVAAGPGTLDAGGLEPGDDLLTILGVLTDAVPDAIPLLASRLLDAQLSPASGERATPGKTFGSTAIRGRVLSAELGVPQPHAREALEIINRTAREHAFAGVVAARFVKASSATLAFTRHAPVTCTIELPGAGSERTAAFHHFVYAALDAARVPFTLHWGQCGDFSPARVRTMYGGAVDVWLAERRALLTERGRRLFANDFTTRCGLAD